MRLLLRRNSHRMVDGVTEIASSPDTPHREQWQWHVRVSPAATAPPAPVGTVVTALDRSDGSVSLVCVSVDPAAVSADVSHDSLDRPRRLRRPEDELVVLVVGSGVARVEGRHLLEELDAMVLSGDDPLEIQLEQASTEPVSMAVIRLSSTSAGCLAWVP